MQRSGCKEDAKQGVVIPAVCCGEDQHYQRFFFLQVKTLYADWLQQHPQTPEVEQLKFSNQ